MALKLPRAMAAAQPPLAVVSDWLFDQRISKVRGQLPVRHYVVAGIPDYLRAPLRWLAGIKLRREGIAAKVPLSAEVHDFRTLIERHEPQNLRLGGQVFTWLGYACA